MDGDRFQGKVTHLESDLQSLRCLWDVHMGLSGEGLG